MFCLSRLLISLQRRAGPQKPFKEGGQCLPVEVRQQKVVELGVQGTVTERPGQLIGDW